MGLIEIYAFDEHGRRLKPKRNADVKCHSCGVKQADCPKGLPGTRCCADCWHPQVMKVRSRPNPGTPIVSDDLTDAQIERAERAHAESKREAALKRLTDDERAVWDLKQERVPKKQTRQVAPDELDRACDQGWQIDHGVAYQVEGMFTVTREVFVRMSYEQIAQKLGITTRQVHRRVVSIRRKLAGGGDEQGESDNG